MKYKDVYLVKYRNLEEYDESYICANYVPKDKIESMLKLWSFDEIESSIELKDLFYKVDSINFKPACEEHMLDVIYVNVMEI